MFLTVFVLIILNSVKPSSMFSAFFFDCIPLHRKKTSVSVGAKFISWQHLDTKRI